VIISAYKRANFHELVTARRRVESTRVGGSRKISEEERDGEGEAWMLLNNQSHGLVRSENCLTILWSRIVQGADGAEEEEEQEGIGKRGGSEFGSSIAR
jgi:hypothetical protein